MSREKQIEEMAKIKQLFCRHRYADKNLDIVEINHYTDTVRLRNYCVKCGKPREISFSYTCMFGKVDAEIKKRTQKKEVGRSENICEKYK